MGINTKLSIALEKLRMNMMQQTRVIAVAAVIDYCEGQRKKRAKTIYTIKLNTTGLKKSEV